MTPDAQTAPTCRAVGCTNKAMRGGLFCRACYGQPRRMKPEPVAGGQAARTVTLVIPMDYPGNQISKNHMWNGGDRRSGMNKEAKRWKSDLVGAFGPVLLEQGIKNIVRFVPPVHVEVTGAFWDRNNAPDLQNLMELISDSVEEATNINDRNFTTSTSAPTYGVAFPSITITVTIGIIHA